MKEESRTIPVGATADIELITDSRPATLAIPTRLLLGNSGLKHVFSFNDGTLRNISVELGLGNYERMEILKGLSEGDIVVYPSDQVELKDGLKAKVEIQPWP